jgi:Dolichyl-phosphate-mannose-protein mannosyltransferase
LNAESHPPFFGASRLILLATLLILFGIGLAIRLYDVTDLPLDFNPTRQLLSELKARGMYFQTATGVPDWQRKMAIQQWKSRAEVEPEVFERLVAFTYRLTGVRIWVARVYSSLFWLLGALFLFLLLRELAYTDGALLSVGYFLFLPYAVVASRSFQPDILMMMLLICFWWLVVRWGHTQAWLWAVLAGFVGGAAIYVKFVAAFFVIGAALGIAIGSSGRGFLRKRQVWVMAALGILPAAAYVYYGVVEQGFLGRQFAGRFIPALLLSPVNYLQWATLANAVAGGLAVAFALVGVLLVRDSRVRILFLGLWTAYLLFGLFFDYHVATHDYYHLPLIGIVAVSMAPLADVTMSQVRRLAGSSAARVAVFGILGYAVLSAVWEARSQLKAVDYRPQAAMWAQVGDLLDHGPNVVALTQDYGSRLAYWGWQNALIWPNSGDTEYHEARGASIDFGEQFSKLTTGNAYFLVTDFGELRRQPLLQSRLVEFAVYAQADGYIIYDLQEPVPQ